MPKFKWWRHSLCKFPPPSHFYPPIYCYLPQFSVFSFILAYNSPSPWICFRQSYSSVDSHCWYLCQTHPIWPWLSQLCPLVIYIRRTHRNCISKIGSKSVSVNVKLERWSIWVLSPWFIHSCNKYLWTYVPDPGYVTVPDPGNTDVNMTHRHFGPLVAYFLGGGDKQ